MSTNILNQTLQQRKESIQEVIDYIKRTQEIFDKHASEELVAAHAQFEPLIQGLQSDKVRIVVIGEFSRGKSRLINALLNINLLPSAKEATTAINTFLQSPPEDRKDDKYIRLHFIDDKFPSEELEWHDDNVLKKWGTELDKTNKDARESLQRIDVFASHDLLDNNLVIIDTPGLESVVDHHEKITREAIASAHIAIWVQSVEQLGGNNREWQFLKETVRQNFRKFLTVINMWDQVLEPEDDHDKNKDEAERVTEKLNTVRDNFYQYLNDLPKPELDEITNKQHLMGVSAKWALSDDSEKQKRSGINYLIERISDLCQSGEAQQEIFYKPLKQLSKIQDVLLRDMDDEISVLSDSRDIKELESDLSTLELEIKNQTLEQKQTTSEFKEDHYRVANIITLEINENLIQPLKSLRDGIDILLTESYIKREISAGRKNIGLPDEAKQRYKQVTDSVNNEWETQKTKVESTLNDLKADYIDEMKKNSVELEKNLGSLSIELPKLEIDLNLDLSSIIEYQNNKMKLESELEEFEEKINEFDIKNAQLTADDSKLHAAQAAYERASRELEYLGPQPSPRTYQKDVKVSDGGMYSDAEYKTVTRTDSSNVDTYNRERNEIRSNLSNREEMIAQLMQEESDKNTQRQTNTVLRRKAELQYKRLEKQQQAQGQQLEQERKEIIAETLRNLRNSTIGELNNRINFLEKNASQMIESLFNDQLDTLVECVEEQFMQPLRAKQDKRSEVLTLFKEGKIKIENKKKELIDSRQQLIEVIDFTKHALTH